MSPRAACRLETLGFDPVFEYHAGKVDWISHCLPVEGERAGEPTAGELARDDVVTCGLDDQVGEVRDRVGRSPYPFALVTSSDGVLLGRLRASTLDCDPSLRAEELMEAGPSTVRPHKTAGGVAGDLAERELRWAVVTSPEGRLIGVASRAELEAAASEWPQPAGGAAR